jgi:hypothetical protein
MKKTILLLACCFALASCGQNNKKNVASEENNAIAEVVEYASDDAEDWEEEATPTGETLNDIRFAGWDKAKWVDNEYIRTVRKYIDAYNNGEITDTTLDEYKDYIQGKFIIGDIQPWIAGGAIVYIIFCEKPDKMFYSIVYSSVNVQTREVYDYQCRGIRLETNESGCTKEDIKQFLKECPEHRMW